MATNIQEALEVGSKTLLIDEDSSATNLLVRDQRMQLLVKKEPITPLISKVRALYRQHGVSTVIVIGGLGDWLSVSDNVIAMDEYTPHIITAEAKAVVQQYPSEVTEDQTYGTLPSRKISVNLHGFRSPYAQKKNFIIIKPQAQNPIDDPSEAEPGIDLSGLDQVVEVGQARMMATLLQRIAERTAQTPNDLGGLLKALKGMVGVDGCLDVGLRDGDLVAVRREELTAALSRFRGLGVAG